MKLCNDTSLQQNNFTFVITFFRKYLNENYEKHILRISGIDERIFIKEDSTSLIGTPTKRMTAFTESEDKAR